MAFSGFLAWISSNFSLLGSSYIHLWMGTPVQLFIEGSSFSKLNLLSYFLTLLCTTLAFARYHRSFMSREALRRMLNLRDDDLFLSFDADEIPKPEVRAQIFLTFKCQLAVKILSSQCNFANVVQILRLKFSPLNIISQPR